MPLLVYRLILGRDVVIKPCPENYNRTYSDGISACSDEMRISRETSPHPIEISTMYLFGRRFITDDSLQSLYLGPELTVAPVMIIKL